MRPSGAQPVQAALKRQRSFLVGRSDGGNRSPTEKCIGIVAVHREAMPGRQFGKRFGLGRHRDAIAQAGGAHRAHEVHLRLGAHLRPRRDNFMCAPVEFPALLGKSLQAKQPREGCRLHARLGNATALPSRVRGQPGGRFKVIARRGELPEQHVRDRHRSVAHHQRFGRAVGLAGGENLVRQLQRILEFGARDMPCPQAEVRTQTMPCIASIRFQQLVRAVKSRLGGFHAEAVHSDVRPPELQLELDLLLPPIAAIELAPDQGDGAVEECSRLYVCRLGQRGLAGPAPVVDGLVDLLGVLGVPSQDLVGSARRRSRTSRMRACMPRLRLRSRLS